VIEPGRTLSNGKTCVLQVTDFKEATTQLRCHVREHMIRFLPESYPQCLPTRRDAVTIEPVAAPNDGQPPILPHRTV
jgi:hypothetical protein